MPGGGQQRRSFLRRAVASCPCKKSLLAFQKHMRAQVLQELGGNWVFASSFSPSISYTSKKEAVLKEICYWVFFVLFFFFFFSPPLQDRSLPPALRPDVARMTKKECFNCLLVMGSVFKTTMLIYSAFWSFLMSTSNCKASIFFQPVPCFLLQFQASVGGYLFSRLFRGKAHAYKKKNAEACSKRNDP